MMRPTHPRGIILLLAILILGISGTTIAFILSESGISRLLLTHDDAQSHEVRSELFGCLDEFLVHLPSNANYAPTSITLGTITCSASVQISDNQRTITLTLTQQQITRRLTAVVNIGVVPITLSSVLEQ